MPPHPLLARIHAGQKGCGGIHSSDVPEETSHAVTCHDEGLSIVDLREWSFSCFMLVPVDEVGCPRKVPEDSHG